ncbi:MAG: methylamine dehydrogenase accessory protein MauD [Gammaproteobacteria bacterium]|nr:methylamine dehydrogenase accessory protein MauD [Gammaproteobacteria bacterium]
MNTALLISNVVLWTLVAGLAVTVLALARQVGILHERIAPAGALMVRGGPKVGEQAPVVDVTDIEGRDLSFGNAREDAKSTLLFFLSPTCPVCKTLLPVLKSSQKTERDWLEIILTSDGDVAAQGAFINEYQLGDFTYVLSTNLGMTYQVGKLPFAVLIDHDGIIRSKGLVNSREHLESLFEAKERGVASVQEYMAGIQKQAAEDQDD